MKDKVNIVAVVDVIGALSDNSLLGGNLSLVDDGSGQSSGQGTPELMTVVSPGQTVQWTVLALDLQTPVEIKNITFLGKSDGNGDSASIDAGAGNGHAGGSTHADDGETLELDVWSGVVPPYMPLGVAYRYRLEVQMYEGEHSVLHIDSPALVCQGSETP